MAQEDLVAVYTVSEPVSAELIKNFLEDEGIRCFIEGEDQAGLQGLSSIEVKILVPAPEAVKARKLIQQHEARKRD